MTTHDKIWIVFNTDAFGYKTGQIMEVDVLDRDFRAPRISFDSLMTGKSISFWLDLTRKVRELTPMEYIAHVLSGV